MRGNPVGWFEIYVDDMNRAKLFYEALFQVKLEKLENPGEMPMEMWSFSSEMESYGATGALVKMDNVKAGGNSTLVYFSCDDCLTEESRAVVNGGAVQVPKMAIGDYGFISVLEDTEGNVIGLHSMA